MVQTRAARWIGLCLLLAAPVADADTPAPVQVVESLHGALLGVMKEAETLGYEGRYERLAPVLERTFDISFMAQKSVGRHWKTLGAPDRERLLDAFRRFTVANYAGRFDAWSGQDFETVGEEDSTHGTRMVHTRLLDPEGEDVQLDYRLRPIDGSWRIIDVHLDGSISELALRRSQYSSLIEKDGLDALLRTLEEKIDELASGKS